MAWLGIHLPPFSNEIMNSDQDSYYLIKNGILTRKAQIMSANKGVSKSPEHDKIMKKKDWPGPGSYSPQTSMIKSPSN